jgi:DNA helicase HerA-like ATPase
MPSDYASTGRIDYIQRSDTGPVIPPGDVTAGAAATRRLLRVEGIGRPAKDRGRSGFSPKWRPPSADLITGLYGYRIPLAVSVVGSKRGVEFRIGTWSAKAAPGTIQDRRIEIIESVLRGIYPVIELERVDDRPAAWPLGGMSLGIPAPGEIDDTDGAIPIDRVIRSMTTAPWELLILAYPAAESAIAEVRNGILNEMRSVESAARSEAAPSPLTDQYLALLKASLTATGEGMATGAWRTGVYLLGDEESYPRLVAVWRSVLSQEGSLPEPVRVFDNPTVNELASAWALPDGAGNAGPGLYQRPFECQTLLSTSQLAACAHLPELESPGYSVNLFSRFDVVTAATRNSDPAVTLGTVLYNARATAGSYQVPLASLARHAFVAGTTGAGKTNTIMYLLQQIARRGVPFLVVEPTKTEYRGLLDIPEMTSDLRVFTAGDPTVAPLVLNPLEVPPGTRVSDHLDLLRAVFAAAFGLWTPLPQILERCLYEVYLDRGWDLRSNENARLTSGSPRDDAFPTLSDLIAKANVVISSLGYEERILGDLRAALVTRLDSLRRGGKGAMFDVVRPFPDEELFNHPTVIELERLGDDGDKAFLVGLILVRLAEYRRSRGPVSTSLAHLLVIEEAHRLLANVPTFLPEQAANPRGEAVQTFANLLSEIRAYGQGVIVADQIPGRLASDVIKNTNLKIAHRVVASDDRGTLAGAMAMDEGQARALVSLRVGQAAVFGSDDDAPLMVQVPSLNSEGPASQPLDKRVRSQATRQPAGSPDGKPRSRSFCGQTCSTDAACELARSLTEDTYVQRIFARLTLSAMSDVDAIERLWEDLTDTVRSRRPPTIDEDELLRAFVGHGSDWLANRRGVQGRWSYADTATFRDALRDTLIDKLDTAEAKRSVHPSEFARIVRKLHARTFEPYPACGQVCGDDPPLCLYRFSVADVVESHRYEPSWREADRQDSKSSDQQASRTWEVCQDASFELVEFPSPDMPATTQKQVDHTARQVAMCFEQQMLAADQRKLPRTTRRIVARILREARL